MRLMTVAVLSTAALAAVAAVSPASAQAPPRRYADNTERITVRPRSFLDPGTATKPGWEHSTDYAFPPQTSPSEYFAGNPNFRYDWKSSWSRMPFPACVDLPNYCR